MPLLNGSAVHEAILEYAIQHSKIYLVTILLLRHC